MASALTGAVVGTFVVGDGTKVGQATFRADKPKLNLKGGPLVITAVADLKQVVVGKAVMSLGLADIAHPAVHYDIRVSSTPIIGAAKLILRGQNIRLVTPTKATLGRGKLNLRGKAYALNRSLTISVGHGKLILEGGAITKVGRAGMVPSAPVTILLTPHGASDSETLTPSPAQAGLLTPTDEDFV